MPEPPAAPDCLCHWELWVSSCTSLGLGFSTCLMGPLCHPACSTCRELETGKQGKNETDGENNCSGFLSFTVCQALGTWAHA